MKLQSRNDAFRCAACGADVPPRSPGPGDPGGCRNHCPRCLASRHVDELLPGDRASGCGGTMRAVAVRTRHGDLQLLHRCAVCSAQQWNVVAPDDRVELLASLPPAQP